MIRTLNKTNCLRCTGYSLQNIILLTGIGAVHDVKELMHTEGEVEGRIVDIEFDTEIVELAVRIDLREKTLKNNVIRSKGNIKRLGYKLLAAQIRHEKRLGYKSITLNAFGDPTIKHIYSGYIVWGKLGYQMDAASRKKFKQLMRADNRTENNIFELLSTAAGKTFWENNGFRWLGEFKISGNSTSMKCFNSLHPPSE